MMRKGLAKVRIEVLGDDEPAEAVADEPASGMSLADYGPKAFTSAP
jgi:rare lipoprotein A (peptidoglycan hydrolase)